MQDSNAYLYVLTNCQFCSNYTSVFPPLMKMVSGLSTCRTKSGSPSDPQPEKVLHTSPPSLELPDASLLLNSPTLSSNLMNASDHSSRVAAAQAENASRKRDSNGLASSTLRSKVPRGNLPSSRNIPDTSDGMLVPPQLRGRLVVIF